MPPGQSLPFSRMSKFVRITAGPCPGRAQRAVGKPGRVAEIHTITVEKMAGRHLRIFCHFPWCCCVSSIRMSFNVRTTADLSPSFHPHSS